MTPVLRNLVVQSSLPLSGIETKFAVDSSGFSTSRFTRWHDVKYGNRVKQDWIKCHIMCGVETHIVTAVEIAEMYTNDTLMLAPMVRTTAENFRIAEVSATRHTAASRTPTPSRRLEASLSSRSRARRLARQAGHSSRCTITSCSSATRTSRTTTSARMSSPHSA